MDDSKGILAAYEKPEIQASYTKEELEEIIQPAGDLGGGCGGCGCGCGCGTFG